MKYPFCLGLATLWFCGFCGGASGQTLHAVSWTASGSLFDVNQATGAVFNPRPTNLTLHMVGIAYRAADGFAYVLSDESFAPTENNRLYRINLGTGFLTEVGPTGLNGIVEADLAVDPTTGLLYGVQDVVGNDLRLFTMNPNTGAATVIGNVNGDDLSAMAFDNSGQLFVLDTFADQLLQVDKATGNVQSSVALSVDLGSSAGMAVDPLTGVFWVADGGTFATNSLHTLDPITGNMSLVGPLGHNLISGLTFVPAAVPEPTTLLLGSIALGGAALAGWKKRRKSQ